MMKDNRYENYYTKSNFKLNLLGKVAEKGVPFLFSIWNSSDEPLVLQEVEHLSK